MLWVIMRVQGSEHSHPVRIDGWHLEKADAIISYCNHGLGCCWSSVPGVMGSIVLSVVGVRTVVSGSWWDILVCLG